jgi:hypothetical protein
MSGWAQHASGPSAGFFSQAPAKQASKMERIGVTDFPVVFIWDLRGETEPGGAYTQAGLPEKS